MYLLLDTSMFKQLSNGGSYLVPESKKLYNSIQNDHTFFKYTSIRIQRREDINELSYFAFQSKTISYIAKKNKNSDNRDQFERLLQQNRIFYMVWYSQS